MLSPMNQPDELSPVLNEVHQMLLRFERKMAVGHVVIIAFLIAQVTLMALMTIGVWRH